MVIAGRNLFHLADVRASLNGYYMDMNFQIFSVKSGTLKQMAGSATASGRYFTLNGQTYAHHYLKSLVENLLKFKSDTKVTLVSKSTDQVFDSEGYSIDREYASSITDGIKRRGTVIASVVDNRLVFGSNPKIHTTKRSWESEIERLARHNPGITFIALDIKTAAVAGGVTWL